MYFCPRADAEMYGLETAVILHKLAMWIRHNRANGKHFHEERTWTWNTRDGLCAMFPFVKKRKLSDIIRGLVADGVLLTGHFNKQPHVRTMWYAFVDEAQWLGDAGGGAVRNVQDARCTERTLEDAQNVPCQGTDSAPSTDQHESKEEERKEEGGDNRSVPKASAEAVGPDDPPPAEAQSEASEQGPGARGQGAGGQAPTEAEKNAMRPFFGSYAKAYRELLGEAYRWQEQRDLLALAIWRRLNPDVAVDEFDAVIRWCFDQIGEFVASKAAEGLHAFCAQKFWTEFRGKMLKAKGDPKPEPSKGEMVKCLECKTEREKYSDPLDVRSDGFLRDFCPVCRADEAILDRHRKQLRPCTYCGEPMWWAEAAGRPPLHLKCGLAINQGEKATLRACRWCGEALMSPRRRREHIRCKSEKDAGKPAPRLVAKECASGVSKEEKPDLLDL